jgi:hypothetical protein
MIELAKCQEKVKIILVLTQTISFQGERTASFDKLRMSGRRVCHREGLKPLAISVVDVKDSGIATLILFLAMTGGCNLKLENF